jgi:hypothetical protein
MNDRLFANGRLWLLALCLLIPFRPAPLEAHSDSATHLLFPRIVSDGYEGTRIFIFNPSAATASVTLSYRDYDGLSPSGLLNPITLAVAPHQLLMKTAADLFGSDLVLDGSMEVSSAVPGLIVQCQVFSAESIFQDGMDSAEASLNLVFPIVPGTAEGIIEIDLFNPNARETAVELKLWSLDGKTLAVASVRVPGGGIYRNTAHNIFASGTAFGSASHITATAKPRNVLSVAQTVTGTSLLAGFTSSAGATGYVDVAAVNALAPSQASNSGVIPYFHTGGQYASTLALANLEAAAVNVTLTLINDSGSTLGTRTISLTAQGGVRAPLQSILSTLGSQEREGWILVQASGRVVGGIIYGLSDAASLAVVPLQQAPKAEFVFSQTSQGSGLATEMVLVNPTSASNTANIAVVGSDGSTLAASQVTIGPSKKMSLSMNQLFPELEEPWSGVLHVQSADGLFATATLWSDSGDMASNISPQEVFFVDNPLTSFAVTGRVTLNDQAAIGFKVALTGAATKYATVDEEGCYIFADVAAGDYSLAVVQNGFQFIPAQADFTLVNASKRVDFQGYTASDAILVRPDVLPVGSPDTTVAIYGKDFDATSQASVDSLHLATTYVNSTQLQAVLPAYLTATADRFQIVVVTNGSGSSPQTSQGYPFIVYQAKPVLTSLQTGGNIVEGNPAGNFILQGTGFLDGAKVNINGSTDGIQVTFVNDQQLVAYVPAVFFEQGGIYPVAVENPYPAGAISNVQLLTVYYPPPAAQSVVPGTCVAKLELDSSPLDIEVLGYGFRRGAVVLLEGEPLFTTYCETDAYCLDTRLYAKVPAAMLRQAGFAKIEVQNPDPSLAISEAVYLCINGLQPTITAVQPGSATMTSTPGEYEMPIIIDGTNFGSETYVIVGPAGSGPEPGDLSVELLSSTRLLVGVTMAYPESLGEWVVRVINPPPGGGYSDPVSFWITEAAFTTAPFLTSLNPASVAAGSRSFTLTVNGSNFMSGAVINFRTTPLSTTVISKNQVKATVPASLIRRAGKIPISVTNPDGGGTSSKLYLEVR